MSVGTTQLSELIRAVSAVVVEAVGDMQDDGRFSKWEGLKALHLIPTILTGIKGVADIPAEARDLTTEEWAALVEEVKSTLVRVGVTHRTADMADRILKLAHLNICEIADILRMPPTAERIDTAKSEINRHGMP